jgi:hypothetical protein
MPAIKSLPRFAIAAGLALSISGLSRAEDFRVDSRVFVGKETTPHSRNVTLFQATHVYDFLDKPRQITFYDLARGRIVLVDPERNVKAEVSRAMLDAFCDNLRRAEKQTQDPVLSFALHPVFDEREEQERDETERVFASKYITYRIAPVAGESAGMAARYREFSDASARLNALVNRGSLPPFPRLAVNESLAEKAQLPVKVHLAISPAKFIGGRTVVFRSEHEYRPRLLDSDLRQINDAGDALAKAAPLALGEFLRPSVERAD